jgi:hypothetical protein
MFFLIILNYFDILIFKIIFKIKKIILNEEHLIEWYFQNSIQIFS